MCPLGFTHRCPYEKMENSSCLLNVTSSFSTTEQTPNSGLQTVDLEVPYAVFLCSMLGVASVVGTFGNTLVLLSVIRFDNLKDIPDLFIFSLSLSDLMVTALYQPLKAYRLTHLQAISINKPYLAFSSFLGHFPLIASITNMFGVTVERLISIRFPLKYDLFATRRRAIVILICIWIFSVTYGAIESRYYFSKMYVTMYFILTIVGTVSIYTYIFFVAKRHEEATLSQFQNRPSVRREHKAAKTIAIILGVALSCWLPFLIVPPLTSPNIKIFFSLQTLSVCNSSINPYIYCARSRKYYLAFVKLLGLRRFVRVRAPVVPLDPESRPRDVRGKMKVTTV